MFLHKRKPNKGLTELREIHIIFSLFVLSLIKMQVNALILCEESQVPPQMIPHYFLNAIQRYFNIIN